MKKIRILKVIFDEKIRSYEIPALRGAVIAKVANLPVNHLGEEVKHDFSLSVSESLKAALLFHNHEGDGFRYAYPLIQYKQLYGNAAITCFGEGVDEIHKFFSKPDWSLYISDRTLPMKIKTLEMNDFTLQVWNQQFTYELRDWAALNQQAHREYMSLKEEGEKREFLRKKLIGNILSFAKGLDWHVDKPIELEILEFTPLRPIGLKDLKINAFHVIFRTNVSLPYGMGLGKNVSLGLGVVGKVRREGKPSETTNTETQV
ncbi:MAG: hypothetical protein K1X92_02005 [Bacteroidia bacterium]|nr:hypothetical protein [Bacteroidia bacterium]